MERPARIGFFAVDHPKDVCYKGVKWVEKIVFTEKQKPATGSTEVTRGWFIRLRLR
jgi:hypothetical protein